MSIQICHEEQEARRGMICPMLPRFQDSPSLCWGAGCMAWRWVETLMARVKDNVISASPRLAMRRQPSPGSGSPAKSIGQPYRAKKSRSASRALRICGICGSFAEVART